MRPEAVRPERGKGQQHAQPQATQQTATDLRGTPGKHRVHGTEEVSEVIGGGNQAGVGQVDLAFTEQVRQLRGQGETADAHGHHQGDKTGGQSNQGRHGQSSNRGSMTVRLGSIDFLEK
ncbi:hypothetical protein D3C71_1019380 [compost metagenome]